MDLLKKAQRWDDKHLTKLKVDKDRISEDLREAMKKSRKESELNTVEQQIQGLETRLKYAKGDRESTVSTEFFFIGVSWVRYSLLNLLLFQTKQIQSLHKQQEEISRELEKINVSFFNFILIWKKSFHWKTYILSI